MLERNLLEASAPRANRIDGTESELLLELQPERRRVAAVHPEDAPVGPRFGPYLGGTVTRAAADALNALFPLDAVGPDPVRLSRELVRARGRSLPDDLEAELRTLLAGDPRAVARAAATLEMRRDTAAAVLRFEYAASVQRQLDALRWISAVQRARRIDEVDADGVASDGGMHVVVRMRAGRIIERRWSASRRPHVRVDRSDTLCEMARENAELLAMMRAAGALPGSRASVTLPV
jgi:excinuclease UvrABC nuclease subunit